MQTRTVLTKESSQANSSMMSKYPQHTKLWPEAPDIDDAAVQDQPTAGVLREIEPGLTDAPQGPMYRLDSWKQIAAHFNRGIRAVQRWEKNESMPVHRHLHHEGGSVYAFQHEVDAWWKNRSVRSVETRSQQMVPKQPEFSGGRGCESEWNSFPLGIGEAPSEDNEDEALKMPIGSQSRLSPGLRKTAAEALTADGWGLSHAKDRESKVEKDINRAINVLSALLPKRGLRFVPWETYYDYAPAARVGGDYCDLVTAESGDLFFFFGDAVGKGIAGSMIASQLYALFRALLSVGLPLNEMFERGNRIFCGNMASDYHATVVCGRASPAGALELINVGHLPPLILRSGGAMALAATGVPLGLFRTSTYGVTRIQLAPGETLFFYTDGITEARNTTDTEYGLERLARFVAERGHLSAEELVRACVADVSAFVADTELSDDRTLMALRHV